MRRKRKADFKTELFTIATLAVILVLLCVAYTLEGAANYTEKTIENYSESQYLLVTQVQKSMSESLKTYHVNHESSLAEAEQEAVEDVIKNAEMSGSKYWFFYSSKGAIFEKSVEETRNVKGKSTAELINYWKIKGADEIELFEEMLLQRKNGSVVTVKNISIGEEIISIRQFNVSGEEYCIGMATEKSYVMSRAGISAHLLYLYSFAAVVCLNLVILVLFLCLTIYMRHTERERNNKSIVDKTLKIEELTHKLNSKTEAVEVASIYDGLTKLYNRKFFDTFLAKIKSRLLMPVSILVADINGFARLNSIESYTSGDDLLEKTAEIFRRVCIETDIVARTDASEFTIIMTGTKEKGAIGLAENIRRQFLEFDNTHVSLSIGVAEMQQNEISILSTLAHARKNLMIDKMLDKNSKSSSIIKMLMKTLDAYSPEAVAHCDRMRDMAERFGKALAMSTSEIAKLALASQLHDVGKIGIPDSVLNKKDALSQDEKNQIRNHSEIGFKIVKIIPTLDEIAIDILQHHEFYDGTGYPSGFKGEEISLNARIIKVLDSFDAMTNISVYSTVKTREQALQELQEKSGTQYDPHIVNEFIKEVEDELFWIGEITE
ncbi:MAG: diguanylate cyclase [Eubacteriales bacterium]|nr:diguanylate cyclase [Eubacteriales bacterium]MDD3349728.1 diguanylate cyclase [Eubacteriales bacterium]